VNFAAKVGLGVAVEYALSVGVGASWARVQHLAATTRRGLEAGTGLGARLPHSTFRV